MMRRGRRLLERAAGERGLAWHVEAAYVGDLPALAAAVLLSEKPPAAAA